MKLLDSGEFLLSDTTLKGNTKIERYPAVKGNPDTTIVAGYFSPMKNHNYVSVQNRFFDYPALQEITGYERSI